MIACIFLSYFLDYVRNYLKNVHRVSPKRVHNGNVYEIVRNGEFRTVTSQGPFEPQLIIW